MPVYEYRCPSCSTTFEQRRPMSESSLTATCPDGHDGAARVLSVFAAVGTRDELASGVSSAPAGPCGGDCACFPS